MPKNLDDLERDLISNERSNHVSFADFVMSFFASWNLKNSALYIPRTFGGWAVGGSFGSEGDVSELLLEDVADALLRDVVVRREVVFSESFAQSVLPGRTFLAVPCSSEGRIFAIMVAWQAHSEPFNSKFVNIAMQTGPLFGEALSRITRINRRADPFLS